MKYILLVLLASCGIKHDVKVKGVDGAKFKFGPDFEAAAAFCDNRYGYLTKESEDCFNDYRSYTSVKVELDLSGIEEFCNKVYTDPDQVTGCAQDLIELLNNATNK
jgi:hypothetical protein